MSENTDLVGTYQLTVIEVENSVRVTEMFHNDHCHLRGKGISYAMIERVHEFFNKEVTSSTTKDANKIDDPEFRGQPATNVWEKLKT